MALKAGKNEPNLSGRHKKAKPCLKERNMAGKALQVWGIQWGMAGTRGQGFGHCNGGGVGGAWAAIGRNESMTGEQHRSKALLFCSVVVVPSVAWW